MDFRTYAINLIERTEKELEAHNISAQTNTRRRAQMAANKENRLQHEVYMGKLILNILDAPGLVFLSRAKARPVIEKVLDCYHAFKRGKQEYPEIDYNEVNCEKEAELHRFHRRKDNKRMSQEFYFWKEARINKDNIKKWITYTEKNDLWFHYWYKRQLKDVEMFQKAGINNIDDLRVAVQEIETVLPDKQKPNPVKEKERALIGCKIPGFFPTPKEVVKRMIELAQIECGDTVLEPSAGNGNIAEEIYCGCDVIEVNHSLREILTLKGFNLVADDFLEYNTKKYDVILMNPPFERFQDIEHVNHAYDLLNSGGRLVAIMCESTFFRSEAIAEKFRSFLNDRNAHIEKLPEKSFQDKRTLRQTGVSGRIVVIEKESETEALAV